MDTRILLLRGPENDRASVTPQAGEPLYTTDEKKLYIGDGATPGGVLVYAPWDEPYDLNADPLGLIAGSELRLVETIDHYNLNNLTNALTVRLPSAKVNRAPRGTLYVRLGVGGSLTIDPLTADWVWEKATSADPDPTIPTAANDVIVLRWSFSSVLNLYFLRLATA